MPTAELIAERLQVSLPLAVLSMLLTVVAALVLGVYAAARHNRIGDLGVMSLSQLGLALPSFWLAILLVLLFAVRLEWFDAGGFPGVARGRRRRLVARAEGAGPAGGWRWRPRRPR